MTRGGSDSAIAGYCNLAHEIILLACKDYKRAATGINRCSTDPQDGIDQCKRKKYEREIREIERFFRSSLFDAISDVDGPQLIKTLRNRFGIGGALND